MAAVINSSVIPPPHPHRCYQLWPLLSTVVSSPPLTLTVNRPPPAQYIAIHSRDGPIVIITAKIL